MAENANSVTNGVLDDLAPIKEEVERIKSNYGSTQSASFNKALMEANNSGIAGALWDLPNHCRVNMASFAFKS